MDAEVPIPQADAHGREVTMARIVERKWSVTIELTSLDVRVLLSALEYKLDKRDDDLDWMSKNEIRHLIVILEETDYIRHE
jgi:hypothetical protein